jgi:ACT domain-containing protein
MPILYHCKPVYTSINQLRIHRKTYYHYYKPVYNSNNTPETKEIYIL